MKPIADEPLSAPTAPRVADCPNDTVELPAIPARSIADPVGVKLKAVLPLIAAGMPRLAVLPKTTDEEPAAMTKPVSLGEPENRMRVRVTVNSAVAVSEASWASDKLLDPAIWLRLAASDRSRISIA